MRFDDRFLDEIRARLSVSHVVGRRVPLKKSGREYRGLSPFKAERTPSFFVNDAKGFYHCFASGEHGDIFKFLMTTEGLSFPEAVERLAEEAGLQMPKPTSREAEARHVEVQDQRERLYALMAASAQFFRDQLAGQPGAEARAYIARRGLKRETIGEFGLGYAPNARSALKEHLARQGFTVADMVASGMLIGGDDIPVPYDRFRHRVMFPIADLKGRVIAFGGRALDPSQPAKYLNSPETPLFHKGNVLFNAARARPFSHKSQRVIVVEGYMDVVALAEAGFGEAVAPLGTALTEEQAGLLWRLVPEPTLCFDGDKAGQKAAFRAIDTVLPHLKPGRSVAFAFLPDGLDPDDLIRQRGAEAMADVLDRSRPLVDILFQREVAAGDLTTPERRAHVEQRLRECVQKIADPNVKAHYEREIRDRWYKLLRPAGQSRHGAPGHDSARSRSSPGSRTGQAMGNAVQGASSSLKNSPLASGRSIGLPPREAMLLRAIISNPWLIEDCAEELASLTLTSEPLQILREALLSLQSDEKTLDNEQLRSHLHTRGFASTVVAIEQLATHRRDRFAEVSSERETVLAQWLHAYHLHEQLVGLQRELEAARLAWHEDQSDESYATIAELQRRLAAAVESDVLRSDGGHST